MKRALFSSILVLLTILATQAQDAYTALKYSRHFYGGTARFVGMGGAFGALGADMSAVTVNPAGLGVYRGSEFSFTPGFRTNETSSEYFGNTMSDEAYDINFNSLGFAISYEPENASSRWKSVNLGVTYNRLADFNQNIYGQAINRDNTIMDYFVNNANAGIYDNAYEGLAEEAYALRYDDVADEYWSQLTDIRNRAPEAFAIDQSKIIQTHGGIDEFAFSVAGNFADKLYLGATLGIIAFDYKEQQSLSEQNESDTIFDYFDYELYSLKFEENLRTSGAGFQLKLGAIYKPVSFLRLGASIHLPTFYDLEDNYYTRFSSNDAYDSYSLESSDFIYDYKLKTPLKLVGSVAFQIPKIATISVDYERLNYSNMRFEQGSDDYTYNYENEDIKNLYKPVNNLRIGAEYKYTIFYLRGGYAYYGSPWKSGHINSGSSRTVYSGGLGLRLESFFIDFAATYSEYDESVYLYLDNDTPLNNSSIYNRYLLTIGFRL